MTNYHSSSRSNEELTQRHKELHGLMFKASIPNSDPDTRDYIRAEHFQIAQEMIVRGMYHPITSPMDYDTLEELDSDVLDSYFSSLIQLAKSSGSDELQNRFPDFSNTAYHVTNIYIEKYSPNQPRDDFGRWVPYGQRGLGGAGHGDEEDGDRARIFIGKDQVTNFDSIASGIVGKKVTAQLLSNLMGNPKGGTVQVSASKSSLSFRSIQDKLVREHTATLTKGGAMHQKLTTRINLPDKTTGEIVSKQVSALRNIGANRFTADATRAYDRDHTYRNMARAGFDAPIPNKLKKTLQESTFENIKGSKRISDLMSTAEGQRWWATHGIGFRGEFDLSPGSASNKNLRSFLRSNDNT